MICLVHSLLAIFSVSYDCVAVHRLEACNAHLPRQLYGKEYSGGLTRQPVYCHRMQTVMACAVPNAACTGHRCVPAS